MSTLQWGEDLALGVGQMDQTHIEFVELLGEVEDADDATLLDKWKTLIEHTHVHFATEDKWMADTQFAASNCHTTHHKAVLDVMREGLVYGLNGQLALVRQMAKELTVWFPQHANSMDAALAWHLKNVGYDTVTGAISNPEALPKVAQEGCHPDEPHSC